MIKKKGVYPFQRFSETKLPKLEDFYSKLNDTYITQKEYNHAQEVWGTFNIKNMDEYHDLYLDTDVLLLVDVFQNFRKTCIDYYGLDPAHYYSALGLAWDATVEDDGCGIRFNFRH